MKRLLCMAMLGAALTGSACAADRPWTDYNRLLEITHLNKFYAAPAAQRDKVIMLGTMTPKNKAIVPSDVVFTIVSGDERKRIHVSADGSFDVPANPAWLKANPMVLTSMPEGEKAGFSFRLLPVLPDQLQSDYATLMGGVKQSNALVKSQAGMLRFLFPTFVGLTLRFPKSSLATLSIGGRRLAVDADGTLRLPLDDALLSENARVVLSERPVSADFLVD